MFCTSRVASTIVTLLVLLFGQLGLAAPAQAQLLSSCKGYSATGNAECTVVPHNVTAWKYMIPGPIRGTPFLDTASAAIETYKGYRRRSSLSTLARFQRLHDARGINAGR